MERLTGRNELGQAYYKKCFEEPCQGMPEDCALCDYHNETVCERLAAYEDTNLLPEKITEIDKLYLEKCQEVNRLNAELAELKKQPQGDLIRRSATIDVIWDVFNQYCNDSDRFDEYDTKAISKAFKLLQSTLEKQPTAYNVEKVAEQLERVFRKYYGENWDKAPYLVKTIDIVRNG